MAYNPEVRRKSYLKNKQRNIEYATAYNRLKRFGVSKELYDTLNEKQKGLCAICEQTCSKALALDHCHETGVIRGLLCNKCNRGLGYLKDNPSILRKAVEYLSFYGKA